MFNDLDDDDVIESVNPPAIEQPLSEDGFIEDFLKTRGIDDTSKIMFEDDSGNIEERSWDSLSKEEKFNILNTPLETSDKPVIGNELTDQEATLLNAIRQSGLTPEEYFNQFQQGEPEPNYKVDDLSDDELFVADLMNKSEDITDEEASELLNLAKQNEELFKKLISGIRKEYKQREELESQQAQAELESQQEEAYNNFRDNIIDSVINLESVGGFDLNLDDKDRDDIARFILEREDESGNTYLWQTLQDPNTLAEIAWFLLYKDEVFNNISEYYRNQIKEVTKSLLGGKQKPQVVIDKNKPMNRPTYTNINDLDDDD